MPKSVTKAFTNVGMDIGLYIGVSKTNDTKRTSIKQQQQEAIKLHSQLKKLTASSTDSVAQQTNVSCSIGICTFKRAVHWIVQAQD